MSYRLDSLSETELWEIATAPCTDPLLRESAMLRFLFPADYGYTWAQQRLDRLRALGTTTLAPDTTRQKRPVAEHFAITE